MKNKLVLTAAAAAAMLFSCSVLAAPGTGSFGLCNIPGDPLGLAGD